MPLSKLQPMQANPTLYHPHVLLDAVNTGGFH